MLSPRIIENIKNAGLTDKESQIYTTLAELGGAFPSRISEITKINRSTVYKILLDLQIKGLINEIEKKNKQYYQIEKPQSLIRYAKDQIKIANDQLENAEKAFPELEGLFSSVSNKPRVTFYDGPDTVVNVCNDMVLGSTGYEMVSISNANKFKNYMNPVELRDFTKAKEALGITTRGIAPDTEENRGYSEGVFKGINKKIWPVIRYIPSEDFPYEAELTAYGKNKVSIVKLGGENIIGVIIEDDVIYGMIRMVFELAWKTAKE
ncbi:MAG: HTH-type transcriptional regulator, sugar sensing transcriptional regulator [Patescibacteria group bacterium]|jgi:sugar-specific transcriptional regulator TrmB|nr:HTH-type transcriptional regulator, sugar sensing transcriptional regulator [Patescibacteria group bacterium]